LPHWKQDGCTYFVTFRLADSVPQDKMMQWQMEMRECCKKHPEPRTQDQEEEYAELFAARFHKWLDSGLGECRLKSPEYPRLSKKPCASLTATGTGSDILWSCRTTFTSWCGLWESIISRQFYIRGNPSPPKKSNSELKREGKVWQDESFDTIVRNATQLNSSQNISRRTQQRQTCGKVPSRWASAAASATHP